MADSNGIDNSYGVPLCPESPYHHHDDDDTNANTNDTSQSLPLDIDERFSIVSSSSSVPISPMSSPRPEAATIGEKKVVVVEKIGLSSNSHDPTYHPPIICDTR